MTPTLILVPGLGDSGPGHWQTLWEAKFGGVRVRQDDWDTPTPATWIGRLQEVIETTPGDLVLVGHSCGALTIVHWAATQGVQGGGGHERVRGALLVAPADVESPSTSELLPAVRAMAPIPLTPLPFPALVVASENDPFLDFERAQVFAQAWDAVLVTVGEAGHISTISGHGDWPDGEVLLSEALHAWTPPDIVRL